MGFHGSSWEFMGVKVGWMVIRGDLTKENGDLSNNDGDLSHLINNGASWDFIWFHQPQWGYTGKDTTCFWSWWLNQQTFVWLKWDYNTIPKWWFFMLKVMDVYGFVYGFWWNLPGKHWHNYGKSPFWRDIFHIFSICMGHFPVRKLLDKVVNLK